MTCCRLSLAHEDVHVNQDQAGIRTRSYPVTSCITVDGGTAAGSGWSVGRSERARACTAYINGPEQRPEVLRQSLNELAWNNRTVLAHCLPLTERRRYRVEPVPRVVEWIRRVKLLITGRDSSPPF